MKQTLFTLVVGTIFFLPNAVFAGAWGIEGGVSMAQSKIEPSTGLTLTDRSGMAGGIFVDLSLASWLSIGPEVLYVQKGSKLSVFGISASYEFDYIDIPLLLKIRLGGQSVAITLFGGGAYGFLMSGKTTALGITTDVSSQLKRNDLSGHFGAALGFMLGKSTELFLSSRYIMGIQDIDDDGDTSESTKNNAIVSTLGFKFDFGKK